MDSSEEPSKPVSLSDRDPQGRFRPGNPGGPGRPRGSRSRMAELLDALADEEAEDIARAVLKLARDGEFRALKFVLDRRWPKHRDRPVPIALPSAAAPSDLPKVLDALIAETAAGELSPAEAAAHSSLIEQQRRLLDFVDHEARLRELEAQLGKKK